MTEHQITHFHQLKHEPSHMEVPVLQVPLLQPLTIIPSPLLLWTTELIRIVQLKLLIHQEMEVIH